jgi:hypothetical protein
MANGFENFMLFLATLVMGFFALCLIVGFCGKVLDFKIKIRGFTAWIVTGVIGWTIMKLIGMY